MNTKISITRILLALSLSIILSWFLYQIWDSDLVYQYRKHYSSNSNLVLDFKDINVNFIEVDIKSRFRINWFCTTDTQLPDFGTYVCVDHLKTWNEVPALGVVTWFKNNKLNAVKVDIPFWHHKEMINHLIEQYGKPTNIYKYKNKTKLIKNLALLIMSEGEYKSNVNIATDEYAEWILPNRAIVSTTLEDDANPFSQSTILWRTY